MLIFSVNVEKEIQENERNMLSTQLNMQNSTSTLKNKVKLISNIQDLLVKTSFLGFTYSVYSIYFTFGHMPVINTNVPYIKVDDVISSLSSLRLKKLSPGKCTNVFT